MKFKKRQKESIDTDKVVSTERQEIAFYLNVAVSLDGYDALHPHTYSLSYLEMLEQGVRNRKFERKLEYLYEEQYGESATERYEYHGEEMVEDEAFD